MRRRLPTLTATDFFDDDITLVINPYAKPLDRFAIRVDLFAWPVAVLSAAAVLIGLSTGPAAIVPVTLAVAVAVVTATWVWARSRLTLSDYVVRCPDNTLTMWDDQIWVTFTDLFVTASAIRNIAKVDERITDDLVLEVDLAVFDGATAASRGNLAAVERQLRFVESLCSDPRVKETSYATAAS